MKSHKLIKSPTISGKCILVLLVLIFCLTMTTFVMNEIKWPDRVDNSSVLRILLNSNSAEKQNSSKFVLVNIERKHDLTTLRPVNLGDSARFARQATNKSGSSSKYYYEEQQPVVVHAESALPTMGNQNSKQRDNSAKQNFAYDDENNDDDYVDTNDYDGYYRRDYSDGDYEAGRANKNPQYNANAQWRYNPWPFSSQSFGSSEESRTERINPTAEMGKRRPQTYPSYADDAVDYEYPMGFVQRKTTNVPTNQANQEMRKQIQQQTQARTPQRQQQQQPQQQQQQKQRQQLKDIRQQQQQQQLQRLQAIQKQADTNEPTQMQPANTESTLLSVIKGLKIMWDIYQAFSGAWNTIAEHRQKQEDALREKLRQQQLQRQRTRERVNSKKPPKFGSNSNATTAIRNPAAPADVGNDDKNNKDKSPDSKAPTRIRSTKAPKTKTATTVKATTLTTISDPLARVEPRRNNAKGDRMLTSVASTLRERRESPEPAATAVAEGRYIKGDPLKGYYDFVITEGSYKFWAIFQTGTAILIIYSVFAAIYYSKVNPLVSDYDYTDYLGGARSMSGGDLDFVDDDNDEKTTASQSASNWYKDILPKVGHSVEFILKAIDRLPAENEQSDEKKEDYRGENVYSVEKSEDNGSDYENEQQFGDTLGNYDSNDYDYTTTLGP